ncbi:sugar nucleotide-binding protein [Duganella sp. FT135W]|uniref:Sugar nucleotide-binding protein n=1 Tax=Duganella flavida TaxID=2692175 RepID=A0A6L8KC78_9BURK|nr:fatty acyl-CoA reductase [Duganella flavida]MYM22031.1 sugar nucleotide-binding protein [Duganella flavida]
MTPALNVQAALSGKRILITGSTGFLAKVVLEKLIRSVPDIGRIVLLIRGGRNGADARTRFERDVATSSVFDRLRAERPAFLAEFFAEKIECITGEVTEPGFGMPIPEFNALARRVDLTINAAASVNFREALDEALAINATSVQNITELARAGHAPLIQVSTCYVNGYNRGQMVEHNVPPARAAIPRHADGHYDLYGLLQHLQHRIAMLRAEVREPEELARRLTELGIAEANYHGWNDTYTFTKWMGEQLAMAAMRGRSLTIVRPSIIESTLAEPVPGWIEGVKVADAIILAYARDKTNFFPAKPNEVVDIVPADLVANSIVLASAEALQALPALRIYQACTGATNPITVGRVIDLIKGESQRNWRQYERLFYNEPKHDFRVVSRPLFLLMLRAMRIGAASWSGVRKLLGAGESPKLEALRTTQLLALTFSFYTAPRYIFQSDRLQALAQRFSSEDQARYNVDAGAINWSEYLCRIHMIGLNRYALRPRAPKSAEGKAAAADVPETQTEKSAAPIKI